MVDPVFKARAIEAVGEGEQRAIGQKDIDALVGQEVDLHESGGVEMALGGECWIGLGLGEA